MTHRHPPMVRQQGLSVFLFLASLVLFTLLVGVGVYYLLDYVADSPTPTAQLNSPPPDVGKAGEGTTPAAGGRIQSTQSTDEALYPDTDPYELARLAGATDDEIEQARQETDSQIVDELIELDDTPADIVLEPEADAGEFVISDTSVDNNEPTANIISELPDGDGVGELEAQLGAEDAVATEADSDAVAETASDGDSTGDLIIAGRVVTAQGRSVSAMTVSLKRIGAPSGRAATTTQTNVDGAFRFNSLAAGDYSLMTMENSTYSAATTIVKAGVTSAELRVAGRKQILITGIVTGEDGTPIPNAQIQTPNGDGIISSASGQYRLSIVAEPDRSYSLRINAQGYREETRHVHASTASQSSNITVDVQMVKAGGVAAEGTVISATGQPVVGATVWLTSPGLNVRGQAVTGELGAFSIAGLQPASDYRVIVNRAGFARYQQNNLELNEQSLPLAIEMNVLPVGNITGLITDIDGTPVPDFTINVVSVDSNGQALIVVSDDNGYFEAEGIPSGEIRFQTRSEPSISLTGLQLPEGQRVQADLVVDWGKYSISGIVENKDGEPYAGARLIARWTQARHGLVSDSTRIAQTNTSGEFGFSQLGPGPHEIIVESNGTYLQKSVNVDPRTQGGVVKIKVDRIP